ncbi:helix-turn-helix domain-containing protein [Actinomadura miaoliensis]|uniref:PucR family transcriptional regulator n=1 Tax=Actinomadura miaoliensis TaxID=430685 RepID=A0ABP7UW81_9ACTN
MLPRLDTRAFQAVPDRVVRRLRDTGPTQDAVGGGLAHFCELLDDRGHGAWERVGGGYVETGRQMAIAGLGLEEVNRLLLRLSRVISHAIKAAEAELDQEIVGALTDAQFGFLEAVSAALLQGYRSESPHGTAERIHRHRHLLDLLLAERPPDPDTVAAAARQVGWTLPHTVAAVALHPKGRQVTPPLLLPDEMLFDLGGSRPRMLLPDPDGPGRIRLLEPLRRDWIVAVGPTVPVLEAAESMSWASTTLALTRQGVIPDAGIVRSIDHVPALVIHRSRSILDFAGNSRLAAFNGLPPAQRERLAETLLALLEHNFNATEAGSALHVHPQTVRYRLRHIERLLGEDLCDPCVRLELQLLLHAQLTPVRCEVSPAAVTPGAPSPGIGA